MKTSLSPILLISSCLLLPSGSLANQSTAEFLHQASLDDLAQTPTLDENFDIFAGLIQPQATSLASGGISQSSDYAPAVTTVITAQDIEAMGATHLDDVLRAVPGLYVDMSGIYESKYMMRGVSALGTNGVVMINGTPIQQLATNSPLVLLMHGGMPVNNIDRIEVVRGPGSALYGADAISGVINIITRDQAGIKGSEVGVRYGSNNSHELWGLHGGTYLGYQLGAFVEFRETDGQQSIITEELQSHFDRINNTHYALAPAPIGSFSRWLQTGINLKRGNWQLRAEHNAQRHGLGVGIRGTLEPEKNRTDFDFSQLELHYRNDEFARYWQVKAKASLSHFIWNDPQAREFYVPPSLGNPLPSVTYKEEIEIREIYPHLQLSALYTGRTDHALLIGAGYNHQKLYDGEQWVNFGLNPTTEQPLNPFTDWVNLINTPLSGIPKGVRRNTWSLLQDTWTFAPHWTLTSGLRYDHFSDFGNVLSPRLSLVWQPNTRMHMKFFYGHAYQAPAYAQMYSTFNLFRGNADLKPIKADSLEWTLAYKPQTDLHLSTSVFMQKIRDQILYMPRPETDFSNLGASSYYGLEFELRWKLLKNQSLVANYALYHQDLDPLAQDLRNAPRSKIFIRHDWEIMPSIYLNSQFYWAGGFERSREDLRTAPADQTRLDFSLHYKPHNTPWSLSVSLRNALDTENRDPTYSLRNGLAYFPDDYPLTRRNWFTELRYQF